MKKGVLSFVLCAIALMLSWATLAAPVNINKASAEEISAALEGVGPVKAEAIVTYRDSKPDGIKSVDELKTIKGIGEKTFEVIKQDVYLNDASMP